MLIRRYYKTGMGFVATLNEVSRSAVNVVHEADLWVKFLSELYFPPYSIYQLLHSQSDKGCAMTSN